MSGSGNGQTDTTADKVAKSNCLRGRGKVTVEDVKGQKLLLFGQVGLNGDLSDLTTNIMGIMYL